MKRMTCALLVIVTTPVWAAAELTVEEKVKQAFERQQTSIHISCSLPNLKFASNKFMQGEFVETSYLLADEEITAKISFDEEKELVSELKVGGITVKGGIDRNKNLDLKFKELSEVHLSELQDKKIDNIHCFASVYTEEPIILSQENVHINMHPHREYDWNGVTKEATEALFAREDMQQIMFLDNYDYRHAQDLEKFMNDTAIEYRPKNFSMPIVDIPESVPYLVASAGHGMYRIETDDLNITYTGGNINYCILNSTRHIFDAFLQYSSGGTLNINYDLAGIVAQKKSPKIARFVTILPNFPKTDGMKYNSIYVKNAFNNDEDFAKEYHEDAAEHYLETKINKKLEFFKKLIFTYNAKGVTTTHTVEGTGEGEYEINMNYINQD